MGRASQLQFEPLWQGNLAGGFLGRRPMSEPLKLFFWAGQISQGLGLPDKT